MPASFAGDSWTMPADDGSREKHSMDRASCLCQLNELVAQQGALRVLVEQVHFELTAKIDNSHFSMQKAGIGSRIKYVRKGCADEFYRRKPTLQSLLHGNECALSFKHKRNLPTRWAGGRARLETL